MIAKTPEDIAGLRAAGKALAETMRALEQMVAHGVSAAQLDIAAEKMIRALGAEPAFLGYKPAGEKYPYPATLCVSVNDEVVHGLPTEEKVFKQGDVVMLDLGLSLHGYFTDMATTVCVGVCDEQGERLKDAAREALTVGIAAAKVGARTGDIGAAIEAVAVKHRLGVVEELGGHSLGRVPHEKPFVPNTGLAGSGELLEEGLVLAIEPIFTDGEGGVVLDGDGWTYRTRDGSRSAEFEHTILVTQNGPEILTQ